MYMDQLWRLSLFSLPLALYVYLSVYVYLCMYPCLSVYVYLSAYEHLFIYMGQVPQTRAYYNDSWHIRRHFVFLHTTHGRDET